MGDLAVVSEYESALDPSKKSKRMCAMELSKALTLMGFGTWNNLEPGIIVQLIYSYALKIYDKNIIRFSKKDPIRHFSQFHFRNC